TPSTTTTPGAPGASSLPTNYGLADSAQSYLNAGGIDAVGAYSLLRNGYGQLPGTGEIITNVSIGDLTDQSMADAGDGYVQSTGPTTVVQNGQRYLDLPSMPLIPTYVAAPGSGLDATGSTEGQDPSMGEIMLDFGVMSPLPHDRQRAGEVGSTYTDLLGIAPGASYRLVVPQQPTFDQIAVALLDAATQTPRPNVISASLGFGTDQQGFPGRYLEDDPLLQSVVSTIVHKYGEVVSISANDGTRLYTPTSVGADGGSTATEVTTNRSKATNINDDQFSTTPTQVVDSGAITAGGTTLDDTLARPVDAMGSGSSTAQSGGSAAVVETRISGGGNFSSGFGSRVDLSAPSDGILSFEHTPGRAADAVTPVLSGGTSASAPEIAAAAAVLLQAAKLGHRTLTPGQVRDILERTGRPVSTPAQIDRQLNVGPQIDVSAAVASVLPAGGRDGKGGIGDGAVDIARLSLAHRDILGELGGEFLEDSDPARIDLGDVSSGGDGEGLVGPVTFGADVTGVPADAHADY
ncbi:MAG: S8 family serine peptidase, partial [Actinocrinis sp.]